MLEIDNIKNYDLKSLNKKLQKKENLSENDLFFLKENILNAYKKEFEEIEKIRNKNEAPLDIKLKNLKQKDNNLTIACLFSFLSVLSLAAFGSFIGIILAMFFLILLMSYSTKTLIIKEKLLLIESNKFKEIIRDTTLSYIKKINECSIENNLKEEITDILINENYLLEKNKDNIFNELKDEFINKNLVKKDNLLENKKIINKEENKEEKLNYLMNKKFI